MSEICGDGLDNDNSNGDALCTDSLDNDRDGFWASGDVQLDCDDNDKWIFPGVQRTCGSDGTQTCQTDGTWSSCAEGELDESTGTGTAYYIDATSGNDSNDCLTRATACAGFLKFTYYSNPASQPAGYYGLDAGDVLYLMNGTYSDWYDVENSWGNRMLMLRFVDGTEANPIKIKAYPGQTPVVDGDDGDNPVGERTMFQFEGVDYVHVSGLEFRDSNGNGIYYDTGTGAEVSNMYMHDIEVEISPSGAAGVVKFVQMDGTIHNNLIGDFADVGGGGRNNVGIRVFYKDVNIRNNTIWNDVAFDDATSGECIQAKHGSQDPTGALEVTENVIIGCSNTYAVASASPNTAIERNLILRTKNCIVLQDVGGPAQQKNSVVRNNYCEGGSLLTYEPTTAYYDNSIGTLDVMYNVTEDTATTYAGDLGVIDIQNCSGHAGCVENDLYSDQIDPGTKITIDENCYYNAATTLQWSAYPGATEGGNRTFAQWQDNANENFDDNSFVEDPTPNSNYEPASTNCSGKGWGWTLPVGYNPGLIWEDGIEPGVASDCEASAGNSCWWVDCDLPSGGAGTYADPDNDFKEIVGYTNESSSYIQGSIGSGDYLYIKGTCALSDHVDYTREIIPLEIGRYTQCGTPADPTVIKSWKGTARAVFDLEGAATDPAIYVRGHNGDCDGIRIQNIEIANHNGDGIRIFERVLTSEVISNYIHGGNADGNGTNGSITIFSESGGPVGQLYNHTVRNNHLFDNDNNPIGGEGNRGGISHVFDKNNFASSSSTAKFYNNIIDGEVNCIRDKHSGEQNVEVYWNLIKNCASTAFYLRGWNHDLHHNVIHDIAGTAFYYSPEDQKAAVSITIRNNTVFNAPNFISETSDSPIYDWIFDVDDNLYINRTGTTAIVLAQYSVLTYDINDWSSSYNWFDIDASTTNFLIHQAISYDLLNGWAFLSDTTSREQSFTGFEDEISRDLYLKSGEEALTASSTGSFVGALGLKGTPQGAGGGGDPDPDPPPAKTKSRAIVNPKGRGFFVRP